MKTQLLLTGLCAHLAAAMPMYTNLTLSANNVSTLSVRDDVPVQLHGYKAPVAIRCDIDDIGPTAHGDGIELIVKNMKKNFHNQPPIMAPGMRQRAGCYFGAVIWWEAKPDNTHKIAMDNWEFIWQAAEDIKTKCIHTEWPKLPCCEEIKHWQVSGAAQFEDYTVWLYGKEKGCRYQKDFRPNPEYNTQVPVFAQPAPTFSAVASPAAIVAATVTPEASTPEV